MGAMPTPQFEASNFVVDYQVNMLYPKKARLFQREGPANKRMKTETLNRIGIEMTDIIKNTNPNLANTHRRRTCIMQWCMTLCLLSMFGGIIYALLYVLVLSGGFSNLYPINFLDILPIVAAIIVIVCCCFLCCAIGNTSQLAVQWREEVLAVLADRIHRWKKKYPAVTFTVIYPIMQYGGGKHRRVVAIWCHLRITIGQNDKAVTSAWEPIYAQSSPHNQEVQQQPQIIVIQQAPQAQQMQIQQQQQPRRAMLSTDGPALGQHIQMSSQSVQGQAHPAFNPNV